MNEALPPEVKYELIKKNVASDAVGVIPHGAYSTRGGHRSQNQRLRSPLGRTLHSRPSSGHSMKMTDDSTVPSYEINVFKRILNDKSLNHKQKEKLSHAILQGNYVVKEKDIHIQPTSPTSTAGAGSRFVSTRDHLNVNEQRRLQTEANTKRFVFKHNSSIELQSRQAPIFLTPVSTLLEKEKERQRNIDHLTGECVWGSQHVEYCDPYVLGATSPTAEKYEAEFIRQQLNMAANISKGMAKKHQVDEVKEIKKIASQRNDSYTEDKRRNNEYQRKISSFRRKLLERLKEKRDPQVNDIMRTVTSEVIDQFVEKFKGCAMTVDAILYHIGANVPPLENTGGLIRIPSLNDDDTKAATETMKPSLQRTNSAKKKEIILDVDNDILNQRRERLSGRDPNLILNSRDVISRGGGFIAKLPKRKPKRSHSPPNPFDDPNYQPSISVTDSWDGEEHADNSVGRAIDAVREELAGNNMLNDMQPEKFLTDEQLLALGEHKTTFEIVAKSALQEMNHRKDRVPVNEKRVPRSLKTRQSNDELKKLKRIQTKGVPRSSSSKNLNTSAPMITRDYDGLYITTSASALV